MDDVPSWPSSPLLALSVVVAVEEGGERSPALGDSAPEPFAEGYSPEGGWRNWFVESMWEYGARSGIWRLLDVLDHNRVRASFAWTSVGAAANPAALDAVVEAGHEIMAGGRRAIPGPTISPEQERENVLGGVDDLRTTLAILDPDASITGWFGRWPTRGTIAHVREAGLEFFSDSHSADAPFPAETPSGGIVVMPWTPDLDDNRFWCDPRMAGYRTASDFLDVMQRSAAELLREAAQSPRMMTVVVHPRISGHPARIDAVDTFLGACAEDPRIWIESRGTIMRAWRARSVAQGGRIHAS